MLAYHEIYKEICNVIVKREIDGFQEVVMTFPYQLTENIIDLLKRRGIDTKLTYCRNGELFPVQFKYEFTWSYDARVQVEEENPAKEETFGIDMRKLAVEKQKERVKALIMEMAVNGQKTAKFSDVFDEVAQWGKTEGIYFSVYHISFDPIK